MGPPLAAPGGFGMSGMEEEIMGRRAPTTLPSLSEIAALDERRRQREAAEAFDLYGSMPEIESVSPDISFGESGMEFEARERPGFMPITGIAARDLDLQRALDMAAVEASRFDDIRDVIAERGSSPGLRYAGDKYINRMTDLLDISNRRARGRGFAMGGEIEGPGTGTSDSIPADIYQDGKRVQKAALSDGEFVMTAKAVKGAGNGSRDRGVSRMYELMRRFESGEMA
jgi:hypothetical protein